MTEVFRRARSSDFKEISALYDAAVKDLRARRIDQWDELYPNRKTLCADIRRRQMYVLMRDGLLVSAIVLNRRQHQMYRTVRWSFTKPAVIHRLCVRPDCQRFGVGHRTVVCAEELLRRTRRRSIRLDAFTGNAAALRLYEGLGYTHVGYVQFRKGEFGLYEKSLVGVRLA
jgi:ribosomal protein S18 acetylase RimI-like enzyme